MALKLLNFNLNNVCNLSVILDKHLYEKYRNEKFSLNYNGSAWSLYIIKKTKKFTYSRIITKCPIDKVVDHINGNQLDNRLSNLRICTRRQNTQNSRKRTGCVSKYKGVGLVYSKRSVTKKWRARIVYNGKPMQIGVFTSEIEAAKAYDKKALQLFGQYARLNFKETKNVR